MPRSLTTEEMFGKSPEKKKKVLTNEEMFSTPLSHKQGFSPQITKETNPETGRPYLIPGKNIIEYGIEGAAKVIHPVLQWVDSISGAPLRKFVEQLQDDETAANAFLAARKQFGENPERAPTGVQIAARAGLSEKKMEFPFPWSKDMPQELRSGISAAELGGMFLSPLTEPQYFLVPPALRPLSKGVGIATDAVISRLPTQALNNVMENRALKAAMGGQNITHFRKLTGTSLKAPGDIDVTKAKISQQAKDILAEPDLLGWFENTENIGPKLAEARKKYGKEIQKIGAEIDSLVPEAVDMENVANLIRDYADRVPEVGKGPQIKNRLYEEAEKIEKRKKVSFKEAQDRKGMFPYDKSSPDPLFSDKKSTNKIRSIINKEMEKTVDEVADSALNFDVIQMVKAGNEIMAPIPGVIPASASIPSVERGIYEAANLRNALEDYLIAKRKYGTFKAAANSAADRFNKNWTNNLFTPSSYAMGGVAALSTAANSANPILSLLALGSGMAANKLIRDRGAAFAARTADKAVKVIENSQKEVMKRRLEKGKKE